MKAGIFDPYLDSVGGGERYASSLAEALLNKGWEVNYFWEGVSVKDKLIQRFSLKIEKAGFVSYSPYKNTLLKRYLFEKEYDLLFYFSDGSIPLMFGKKNLLHFQVPFKNVLKKSLINSLKLLTINGVICNSLFTKNVIDMCLGITSKYIYPPVDVSPIKPLKKKNIIIAVGRFSQLLQGKRQDILIESFIILINKFNLKGWKLILAGGSDVGASEYIQDLKKMISGCPVEIIENPTFQELIKLYGEAKIFWTASGYGIDENINPEKVEHFGMTTVEAMAAGCVPIVQGKGGQKEIITEDKNGFCWLEKNELQSKTLGIILNPSLMKKISLNAILRSREYSKEKFIEQISKLI